jgi:hypothetical protein
MPQKLALNAPTRLLIGQNWVETSFVILLSKFFRQLNVEEMAKYRVHRGDVCKERLLLKIFMHLTG